MFIMFSKNTTKHILFLFELVQFFTDSFSLDKILLHCRFHANS